MRGVLRLCLGEGLWECERNSRIIFVRCENGRGILVLFLGERLWECESNIRIMFDMWNMTI
jgi:hypothetical protein